MVKSNNVCKEQNAGQGTESAFRSVTLLGQEYIIPTDVELRVPDKTGIDNDKMHFLVYIPWDEQYKELVPEKLNDFFEVVRPYLAVRTTDVHTAICLGYLDELVDEYLVDYPEQTVDRRLLGISLILHDCGWSKLSEAEVAASLGVQGLKLTAEAASPKEKHAVEGAKLAAELLENYSFDPELTAKDRALILDCVRFHDQPEMVAKRSGEMSAEVQLLVDLDHLWSFTHLNFWQDVVRKGVAAETYLANLGNDLNDYFVTDVGKAKARSLLVERSTEVEAYKKASLL